MNDSEVIKAIERELEDTVELEIYAKARAITWAICMVVSYLSLIVFIWLVTVRIFTVVNFGTLVFLSILTLVCALTAPSHSNNK